MNRNLSTREGAGRLAAGVHPLAAAVAVALAGALGGCATQAPAPDASPVTKAKAAYAQQNYGQAAQLLTGPAEKGDPDAQYALGYLYYYGQGVPRDLYRAQSWFETSARLGNGEAKRALVTLRTYGQLPRVPRTETAAAPVPAPAPTAEAPRPVAEAATPPAAAPVTPSGAAGEAVPPAEAVAPAPVAPAPNPVAAAPEAAPAPAAEIPAQAPPAPAQAPAPAEPQSDTASAQAGVAVVTPVSKAKAPPATSSTHECAPAGSPAPMAGAAPAHPAGGGATAKAPAQPAAPNGDSPDELPDDPVIIMGEEGSQAGGTRAVALRRPSGGSVTPLPGGVDLPPPARRAPAPTGAKKGRYTIHLLSSPSREELFQTVRSFGLAGAAWYPIRQGGALQYRLIYGGYDTWAEAKAALHALPQPLFARKPWINNYPESVTVTAFNGIPTARIAAVEPGILR